MKNITVISSACGAMFMPGFFKCLRENGERNIRIIGIDISDNPMLGGLIDEYYQVPAYTSNNYIDTIIEICIKEKVDIFFPHISMELPIVLSRIDIFKRNNIKVAITDNNTLLVANNKYKLYEFMKEKGFVIPKYYLIKSLNDYGDVLSKLGYPNKPVCIKVTESSGSRGIRIIKPKFSRADSFLYSKPSSIETSYDDMYSTLKEFTHFPEIFAMEYLPGCEYTVDLLADHGKTLYICGRRNLESSISIAMKTITEKKDEAYQLCQAIVYALKLDGNIGFDFMLDENDNPILTDLNPRITATIVLYLKAGINFPYLRIKQLLNEDLPKINEKYGVKLIRKYLEIFEGNDI